MPQNVAYHENIQTLLTFCFYTFLGSFLNQNYLVVSLE